MRCHMIDWESSKLSPEIVKLKDRVVVVCEKCHTSKTVLYTVAKRRQQHLCMSCIKKKGEFIQGDVVIYKCIDCGLEKQGKYDSRYYKPDWRCHHCAMVHGHKLGKFVITNNTASEAGKKRIAEAASANWDDPEYREKWLKTRSKNAKLRWKDPSYRAKMAEARAKQSHKISSIQHKLYKYLSDLNVVFYKEGKKTQIGYYAFDCLVEYNGKKLLIECQGNYWHSLKRHKDNDRSKFTYINRYFPEYEIMYIWEHEFESANRVLDRLELKLGIKIQVNEFNFKDVIVKQVDWSDTKEFLDAYHYLGGKRNGICFGAYLGEQLIACMLFSSPLRQNTAGQFGLSHNEVRELSRLCIHPSYHKKNFATWFISRCLKSIDCNLVVAYADTTVGHTGTIYKAANFHLHHKVPSDYWYIDKDGFVMHKRTLYGRAVKMGITEAEFAKRFEYIKKYGGEKLCFIKSL